MAFACRYGNRGQSCPNYFGFGNSDSLIPIRSTSFGLFERRSHPAIMNNDHGLGHIKDKNQSDRRSFISGILSQTASFLNVKNVSATDIVKDFYGQVTRNDIVVTKRPPITVTLPLEPASGGTFCVRCTLFEPANHPSSIPSEVFKVYRAIIDTGSPYLVLPSRLHDNRQNQGGTILSSLTNFFHASAEFDEDKTNLLANSEYPPTDEIYGSVKGQIDWKLANYKFRDPRLQIRLRGQSLSDSSSDSTSDSSSVSSSDSDTIKDKYGRGIVGVLDDALTSEATGGLDREPYALLGLIRNNNPNADKSRFPDPRPTFLEQESLKERQIQSFCLNGPERELSFSTGTLIVPEDCIMKLIDLRPYGDFVDHYTVLADSVTFDGVTVTSKDLQKASGSSAERPIVAVFDTGLTGCLLTRPFWDVMQQIMFWADSNAISTADNVHTFQFASIAVKNFVENKKGGFDATTTNSRIQSSYEENPRMFYIDPIDLDWFDDKQTCPYVIVLGQTFLSSGVLTVDMERRISTFS